MLKNFVILFLLIGVLGFSAIANWASSTNINENSSKNQYAQNIPSNSLFAKIRIGMGQRQVMDLIGQPSDLQTRMTGKNWIPFYFGSDRMRTIYYYKGQGRIFFSGNSRVMKIDYDPAEDGYR